MKRCGLGAAILLAAGAASPTTAHGSSLTTLFSFSPGPGGNYPSGVLLDGGVLYGATQFGGSTRCNGIEGCGTAFRLDPATGAETVLFDYKGPGLRPANPQLTALVGDKLYGIATNGGTGAGSVFRIDPATKKQGLVYSFTGGSDGKTPDMLIYAHGMLYGTTLLGGAGACGTVFEIDPATRVETVLYSFGDGADGGGPNGLVYKDGSLYGVTDEGGTSKRGVIFKVDTSTSVETVIHAFKPGRNGWEPAGGLVLQGNQLYGTTYWGGVGSCQAANATCGTVFKADLVTGATRTIYRFLGPPNDCGHPLGPLVYLNGTLYGITMFGGTASSGCIFGIDVATGAETLLYSFVDGRYPNGLIYNAGTFYGTTISGGAYGLGTVFSFTP